jgi:alpha-L-arabinofuranosidase
MTQQINRKKIINYHWKKQDKSEIPLELFPALEKEADKQIYRQLNLGYVSGNLQHSNNNIDYIGTWEIYYF